MNAGRAAWAMGVVAVAAAATAWGLAVSVVVSTPTVRRAEIPAPGLEREHGRARTVVRAAFGEGDGQVGISFDGETRGPQSLAVDDQDRIWVLDSVNSRILRFEAGMVNKELLLPRDDFDDIAVSGEYVCALARSGDREVLVIAPDGTRAPLPIAEQVPPVYRLFLVGQDVVVECPGPAGRTYHAVGRLDGTGYPPSRQSRPRAGATPLPNGCTLDLAMHSRNDVAVDVNDGAGNTKVRLRAHSDRDIAVVLDATGDRSGNLFVTWALASDDPTDAAAGSPSRIAVTRHAPDGELVGWAEADRIDFAEPFRRTTVSESGDIYLLEIDRNGARVVHLTPLP